ncbi:MAG TPA: TIGR04255 family protein, partial [Mycobacteriales bacterium]|nr:TIGR04255 family protein [Mycobacteriales bacterium]
MDLPEYTSKVLARSPLVLVATQINFEDVGGEVTHAQARQMQKVVGPRWSQLQAAPQMKTTMTPAGAVNEPNRNAYRLLSTDGSWAALLNPDSVTLETRSYSGWDQMLATIKAFAQAIAD